MCKENIKPGIEEGICSEDTSKETINSKSRLPDGILEEFLNDIPEKADIELNEIEKSLLKLLDNKENAGE